MCTSKLCGAYFSVHGSVSQASLERGPSNLELNALPTGQPRLTDITGYGITALDTINHISTIKEKNRCFNVPKQTY